MTIYNVHIYREMKLRFDGIEADTPESAALIARDRLTEDADAIADCNGENMGALIDVVGDDDYEHSVSIDFEAERLRKATTELLDALQAASNWIDAQVFIPRTDIQATIQAAIAKATTGQGERRPS
jgi:hypothetical protein